MFKNPLSAQAPTFTSIKMNGQDFKPYEKVEFTISLNRDVLKYANSHNSLDSIRFFANKYRFPHDSAEVHLLAVITSPTGKIFRVQGFYHQQFYLNDGSCGEPIKLNTIAGKESLNDTLKTSLLNEIIYPSPQNAFNAQDAWKIRFTPDTVAGQWNVRLMVSDKYGVTGGVRQITLRDTTFTVNGPPANDGFLRILEGRHRYIYRERTKNMEYLIPGTTSIVSINKEYSCSFLGIMEDFKEHNINLVRVWIDGETPWQWYTALKLIGYDKNNQAMYSRIFNQMNCARLDTLFDLCYQNNVNIQLVLFVPPLSTEDNGEANNAYPMYKYCAAYKSATAMYGYSYKQFNIGEFQRALDFYTRVNNMQRNMIRYAVGRWGYSTNLLGWEIGNELTIDKDTLRILEGSVQKIYPILNTQYHDDTIFNWMKNIYHVIKYYDPHKHIVTSSMKTIPPKLSTFSNSKILYQDNLPQDQKDYNEYSGGDAVIRNRMDINVPHTYDNCPICPDSIYHGNTANNAFGVVEEKLFNKPVGKALKNDDAWSKLKNIPVMVQEWGFDDACGQDLNKSNPILLDSGLGMWDPYGIQHHNVFWMMLFSHSAGLPLSFNGPGYGEKLFLWKGAGNFWKGYKDIPDAAEPKLQKIANYRATTLTWPDKKEIDGWIQDTSFLLYRIKRNHFGYLRTFDIYKKPEVNYVGKSYFVDQISNSGVFRVEYVNTLTGDVEDTLRLLTQQSGPFATLSIPFPKFLSTSLYGDFAFRAKQICTPRVYLKANNYKPGQTFNLKANDTLKIDVACGGNSAFDSMVISEIDSNGNPINSFVEKQILPLSTVDTLHIEYFGTTLPLWCIGATYEGSQPKKRYFKITLFAGDCNFNSQSYSIKYTILPENTNAKLVIDNIFGDNISSPLIRSYGEDLILDNSQSTGVNYSYYELEETNVNNTSGTSIVSGGINPGTSKVGMAEYFAGIQGPPYSQYNTYLQGNTTNTRYYRIILTVGRYLGCNVPTWYSQIKKDTAYVSVSTCHANAYFKIQNDTNYSSSSPFDWYTADSISIDPIPNGATRLEWQLQLLDNIGIATGPIATYSYGANGAYHQHNLNSHFEYLKSMWRNSSGLDTSWFTTVCKLKLQIKSSNINQGGCDADEYWNRTIRINYCNPSNNFRLEFNNQISQSDTIWIDEGDSVFINAELTKGINKIDYLLEKSVNGGVYTIAGETYSNLKHKKFNANILCQSPNYYFNCNYPYLLAWNGDSTLYRLTLTGYRNSLSNCRANDKYLYIGIRKVPAKIVTLGGQTWDSGTLHAYCDTTNWLPLSSSVKKGVLKVTYNLDEMELTEAGTGWKVIQRYIPTTKPNFVFIPNYGYFNQSWQGISTIQFPIYLEANRISEKLRMYKIDKKRTWRLRGSFYYATDTVPYSFLWNYSDCPSAPPLANNAQIDSNSNYPSVRLSNSCISFPVPSDQNLTIKCDNLLKNVLIFDLQGRLMPVTFIKISESMQQSNLGNLAPGVYLLNIEDVNGVWHKSKVIKI